jgi:hypothetical protein
MLLIRGLRSEKKKNPARDQVTLKVEAVIYRGTNVEEALG